MPAATPAPEQHPRHLRPGLREFSGEGGHKAQWVSSSSEEPNGKWDWYFKCGAQATPHCHREVAVLKWYSELARFSFLILQTRGCPAAPGRSGWPRGPAASSLHRALLVGLPDMVGVKDERNEQYAGCNGNRVLLRLGTQFGPGVKPSQSQQPAASFFRALSPCPPPPMRI